MLCAEASGMNAVSTLTGVGLLNSLTSPNSKILSTLSPSTDHAQNCPHQGQDILIPVFCPK